VAAELKAACVDAVSVSLNAGDRETYMEICKPTFSDAYEAVIEFIRKAKPALEVEVTTVRMPEVDLAKAEAVANGLGVSLRQENPNLNGQAFLDKLDAELQEMMPEKFGKKRAPNPMEGSPNGTARPTVSSGKKSYNNLPAEARAACDKFVKQGLMTKEAYVAEYDWE
jgi:MoaA/NifB/PqqE/SkfB family radical SAM enzyme